MDWFRLYPEMIVADLQLHHLYRALDVLHKDKEAFEKGLFWPDRDLLNMHVDVVLYDLTTLHFESIREDIGSLRRFRYSEFLGVFGWMKCQNSVSHFGKKGLKIPSC